MCEVCISLVCLHCVCLLFSVLLQHGADPNIRNTDGKSALDLADPSAKAVLTGQSLLSPAQPWSIQGVNPEDRFYCSNICVDVAPGEYKKDELLEAAR